SPRRRHCAAIPSTASGGGLGRGSQPALPPTPALPRKRGREGRCSPMFAYIVRRILATIPVMAVVAIFVFALLYLSPGDPAAIIAGDTATVDDILRIRAKLGLDQPFYIQFGSWVWRLMQGDLGISIFTNLPVTKLIEQRLEPTVAL